MRFCPFCAEAIQDDAICCRHCGQNLLSDAAKWAAFVRKYRKLTETEKAKEWETLSWDQQRYLAGAFGIGPPRIPVQPRLASQKTTRPWPLFVLIGIALVYYVVAVAYKSDKGANQTGSQINDSVRDSSRIQSPGASTTSNAGILSVSEKELYCRIFTCTQDQFAKRKRFKQQGTITYYEYLPRGEVAPGVIPKGAFALEMFCRPHTKANPEAKTLKYDEVWTERVYADMDADNKYTDRDELSDVGYTYWLNDRFVIQIAYSSADKYRVPFSMVQSDGSPSPIEQFTYKNMRPFKPVGTRSSYNEIMRALEEADWFILDSISDRTWFDAAVREIK